MLYEVRDLTNQVFGELTVLDLAGVDKNHHALWNTLCSCGVQKVIRGTNMRAKKHPTISCGHVQKAMAKKMMSEGGLISLKGVAGENHPMWQHKWEASGKRLAGYREKLNPNFKHGLRCEGVKRRVHRDWQKQQKQQLGTNCNS